ncbi:MAG: hypothetical protein IT211_07835 [Armatimonadetes bacterium]|nr:hypothetical protein [Armatimonadota bacterium]
MEPTLHMKQGLNLLNRVLQFYPIMQEGDCSTVQLTEQDWLVLMDFTDNPDAQEHRPEQVQQMSVDRSRRIITIQVPNCLVEVKMGM